MNVLVIAAHPDDEVLGVGGTILKHIENKDEVYLLIMTVAYEPEWSKEVIKEKRREALAVSKALGVKETFFAELPTVMLDRMPEKVIIQHIKEVIKKTNPVMVYTHHWEDMNQDHRVIHSATMVATKPIPNSTIKKVLAYESRSSTEWGSPSPTNQFIPSVYEDMSKHLEKKLEILKLYQSEIQTYPHPRSIEGVKESNLARGKEVSLTVAEAFVLLREIR